MAVNAWYLFRSFLGSDESRSSWSLACCYSAAIGTTIGQNHEYGPRNEWLHVASILMINTGRGGRCCHLAHSFARGLRGLSLICFQIFVRLGWSEFNWENMKAVLISCSRKKPVRDRYRMSLLWMR